MLILRLTNYAMFGPFSHGMARTLYVCFRPVQIRNLDEHGQASITAHSLAAYVSCLNEDHLKKFTTKVTSDCQLWLSKMFR